MKMTLTPLLRILCCAVWPEGGLAECIVGVSHIRGCMPTSSYMEYWDSSITKVRTYADHNCINIGGRFQNDFKPAYDLSHKATRYLALPCLNADLYRADSSLSTLHLISGLVPFAMALAGNDNIQLGNLAIACNIISLAHYSLQNNRDWGLYTAAAGLFAYFLTPKASPKILYPLSLALMEFCAYRMSHIHIDSSA